MDGRKLRLTLFCCCLLLKGARCSPPGNRRAEDQASSSISTSRGARAAHPVKQFHNKLKAQIAATIARSPGAGNGHPNGPNGPNGPAEHQQVLARRIVQDIQGVEATDIVATIASFHLVFTAVVWPKAFRPGAGRYLIYGNSHDPEYFAGYHIECGTRALDTSMQASDSYFPGLGSPAASGASLFVPQEMQNGVVMSCMLFYMRAARVLRRDPEMHMRVFQQFRQALRECNEAELVSTGLSVNLLTSPIDLDRLALCMWRASKRDEHSPRRWRGVAAVTAYTLLVSHTSPHPDMGIWAPEGNIALEYATFAVPTVDLVSVDWVYVYVFSVLE